jgi:cytochrome c peroxidase
MKKTVLLPVLIVIVAGFSAFMTEKKKDLSRTVSRIAQLYISRVISLDSFLQAYPHYFYDSSFAVREKKYEELSFYFRESAGFIIYFEPKLYYSKLTGPFQFHANDKKGFFKGLPDAWLFQGPIGNEPDSMLLKEYGKQDSLDQEEFITQAILSYRKAIQDCHYAEHVRSMNESELFDALRKEIFRISTIDIANSDFIIEDAAIPGLNGSLDSWLLFTGELARELPGPQNQLQKQWTILYTETKKYLADHKDFYSFNRMFFIKNYLIPLSRFLSDLQVAFEVPFLNKDAALKSDARDIYGKDVFNADYFAPDKEAYYSSEKAKLGELLFFDPILSDNNQRACASCHKPALAFTDGKTKSVAFGFDTLPRNSPTVINAGFQNRLFWDLRAGSLEDQLDSVVNNVREMHSSFYGVIEKLNASPEYTRLFHQAFPNTKKTGITRTYVKYAIGVYERTLTGLNSRFDQYMQGDDSKLSAEEINGFNVYMGKAKCGVCHFAPMFNGSLPPFYDVSDNHAIGVPIQDSMVKYVVDPDLGLMKINGEGFARFSFKTPTVRNVALTSPYMHNGLFKTLEQVVDFYDHAAGNKFTKDMRPDMIGLPFFTILPVELKLTNTEKKDLVSFLKALTDTSASAKVPVQLPRFNPPYAKLNGRTIGGNY